jgi:5-methylcytosine-specific restriction protein B
LNISGQGNWATLNINLMDAIKSQGLQSEDVFLVNTFVWWLYERLVENQQQHDNKDEEMQESNASEGFIGNVIYYGPPGTGKTYKLQGILKGRYTDKATTKDKKAWVLGKLEKLSWFEVVALILLESDKPMMVPEIKAHDYFQHKIDLNGREANISQTAWAALQTHTIQNSVTVKYQKRVEPTVLDMNEGSSWFIVDDKRDQLEELINLSEELVAGPGQVETVKRYEFVTFHQSYGYEEFIEGLRPVTNSEGDISYEVKSGVFKRLCTRAKADPQNRYSMVSDEINRGNISKIFGELITLVEIDKRAGANNALQATLAYSEAPFSVPSNVDVIGSMNTADRSLTHIDVALRRRFEFEELRTNYCTVSDNVNGINLRRLLYAMNQRIELLLDRDHILGHALVMKVESITALKHVFKTNILPLLEEYFFENWEKIDQVLNNNGFVEEQKDARVTWLGEGDDYAPNFYFINEAALGDIESYKSIYAGVDASFFPVCDKDAIEN